MSFPAVYNLQYYRGDTLEMDVSLYDGNGDEYQVPAGYTAYLDIAKIRAATAAGDKIARITLDSAGNVISFKIPSTTGLLMYSSQSYVYDVQIEKSGAGTYTLMTGTITVTDNVVGA